MLIPNDHVPPSQRGVFQTLEDVFHSFSLELELAKYGKLLRQVFWAYVAMFACLGLLLSLPWQPDLPIPEAVKTALLNGLAILTLAAVFYFLWTKWQLYEFDVDFPGRWFLSVAFWCDLIHALLKLGRDWLPDWPAFRLAEVSVNLLGFIFFLLFLRALALLIQRPDLVRLAFWTLALGALGLLGFGSALGIAILKLPGVAKPIFLSLVGISLVGIGLHIVSYARLIWQLGSAIFQYAKASEEADFSDQED